MTGNFAEYHPAHSPLFMAIQDPAVHGFISYLTTRKRQHEDDPSLHLRMEIPRGVVSQVRDAFKQKILSGESYLHIMAHVLASTYLGRGFELHSNVIGSLPGGEERPFLIRERITRDTLLSQTDLDLGNQTLGKFRYLANGSWQSLNLSANFVEYIPDVRPATGVNRLTSRVKAEEELWNKVVDELFGLDVIVERDKHLRQFSKYIKDIFGLKIVCEDEAACLRVHEHLIRLRTSGCDWTWLEGPLSRLGITPPTGSDDSLLEFIETKDYLTCDPAELKKTGWKAIKSVVRWQKQLLEIQVQPFANYYLELDHMAGPSHSSFKLSRDAIREKVATQIPLYGFYRDLLKTLFVEGGASFESDRVSVVLVD